MEAIPPVVNVVASANPLLPQGRNEIAQPRSQYASYDDGNGALRQSLYSRVMAVAS